MWATDLDIRGLVDTLEIRIKVMDETNQIQTFEPSHTHVPPNCTVWLLLNKNHFNLLDHFNLLETS